jgi:hypothetical protein
MAYVDALPIFESVGRVNLFITPPGAGGELHRDYHRDHGGPPRLLHFVWLQLHRDKPFYLFDPATDAKRYVEPRAVWFNSNQYHGSDPVDFYTWSLRIDGKFTEALIDQLGPAARR